MSGARAWPMSVVLSVASGTSLGTPFADAFELITELAGWPVYTHQLARPDVWDGCRDKIVDQVPWVAHAIENMPTFDQVDRDLAQRQLDQYLGRIIAIYGPDVVLDAGDPMPMLPFTAGLEHLSAGEHRG